MNSADEPDEPCDYVLKFLVLGDTGVGKTSILTRYVEDRFNTTFSTTVGVDFCQKKVKFDYKGSLVNVQLQLWDTAGQERFRSLTSSFFRDAMGFLLVFDLTNESSFHHINDWLVQLHTHCYNEQPPVVIVGNKVDLERVVERESAEHLTTELGFKYIESSAMDNINVNEAVGALLELVLKNTIENDGARDKDSGYLTIAPEQIVQSGNPSNSSSCFC